MRKLFWRTGSFWAAALLLAFATTAQAGETDPARLFQQLPSPPESLTAAASQVTVVTSPQNALKAPVFDALENAVQEQIKSIGLSVRDQVKSSGTAEAQQQVNQMMTQGIDVQRMQSDPSYAAQMQKKLSSMSMPQKIAMAQRLSVRQSGGSTQQMMEHGQVMTYIGENSPKDDATRVEIRQLIDATLKASNARHNAVSEKINTAFAKCPFDKFQEPDPDCSRPLIQKVIKQQRLVEAKALQQENAAYQKARALAKTRVDAAVPIMAMARQEKNASDEATLSSDVGRFTMLLTDYGRKITVRAGFWAKAQCEPVMSTIECSVKAGKESRILQPQ